MGSLRVHQVAEPDVAVETARSGDVPRRRRIAFVALVLGCLLVGGGYGTWAFVRAPGGRAAVSGGSHSEAGGSAVTAGRVLFQHVIRDSRYGTLASVPTGRPATQRQFSGLTCERAHFAAGRGLCVVPNDQRSGYVARTFGPDFAVLHEIPLSGIASRARVSPDGRYGAVTVFVLGHSYAEGKFSTTTTLIDMARGKELVDLEQFSTTGPDGKTVDAPDVNYWGVTFARNSDIFYATLATGEHTYLVKGHVASRRARVLRENVECPSLSPDGSRIAYKKRVFRNSTWRFYVLDLKSMKDTPLAEPRSVDDQVEWLDDAHVLYGAETSVWVLPADGSGRPQEYLAGALSPAVVRG